jgi:dimethylaniline monooxygenase (N-oxide forming)
MNVCVIGAGPSGLCAAKEIREINPTAKVTILEHSSSIGGTFARSYKGLTLVNNPLLISFSDFLAWERLDDLRMWTAQEYVAYLERYVEANKLFGCIRFRSTVIAARFVNRKWHVTVSGGDGTQASTFDHLVVCSGSNSRPNLPVLENQQNFTGRIVHSSDVKDPAELKGLRVVFVGLGETGSDLGYLSSESALGSVVSVRRRPGYLIPRYHDGRPTDLDTSRIYHSLPKNIDNSFLSGLLRLKRRIERRGIRSPEDAAIQDRVDLLNEKFSDPNHLGPFRRASTKSCGFIRAQLAGRLELKPEITRLEGGNVHFSDGSVTPADIIVCCTGYKQGFDFLGAEIRDRMPSSNALHEYMFMPEYGDKLAFIGFVRPGVGTVPAIAELQSRYLGLVLRGHVSLPGDDVMAAGIRRQQENARKIFPLDFDRISHIVDYYPYMAGIAKRIDVLPSQWYLFFTDTVLWYKVNFSFLCPGIFRLHGPGAKAEVKAVIRALPTMPRKILFIEGFLYLSCRILSIMGLRRFRPLG